MAYQIGRINGPALADNLQRESTDTFAFETDLLVIDGSNGTVATSGALGTSASTTARAGLNIAEGVAPTVPVDGDVWVTAAGAFNVRLNGATLDFAASGDVFKVGTPVDNQIGIWTGDGTLEGDANFTWSGTALTVNGDIIIDSAYTTAYAADVGITPELFDYGTGLISDNIDALGTVSGIGLGTRGTGKARWDILNVWQSANLGDLVFRARNSGTSSAEWFRMESDTGLATFAAGVTVSGAFTSLGINDDASQQLFKLQDPGFTKITIGRTDYTQNGIGAAANTHRLTLSGGTDTSNGASIWLYGSAHTGTANDIRISTGGNNVIVYWDESIGDLEILTGIGTKTTALTIDASKKATFVGTISAPAATTAIPSINIAEGVAPTTPVDGDVWVTAAGAFNARLNGVSVDLSAAGGLFTEDSDGNIVGGTGAGANLVAVSALENIFIGQDSGAAVTTGDYNTAIGWQALNDATAAATGSNNTAIGNNAMSGANITSAHSNIAMGFWALHEITIGIRNICLGDSAGRAITTGDYNIAMGYRALYDGAGQAASGDNNIAMGQLSMSGGAITTATNNIAMGASTLVAINAGAGNIAMGFQSGNDIAGGNYNIAIGQTSGSTINSGSNNVTIGINAGNNITTGDNNVAIGNGAGPVTNQSNKLFLNNAVSDTPLLGGDFSTGIVTFNGAIRFTERADHIETPTATFGELWTRNDVPNALVFTDDAGNDWQLSPSIATLAATATPSVAGGRVFLTGSTTTITDFTLGAIGQEIIILSEHAITITDGTNMFLAGSANFVMASTDSLHLIQKADGNWYEITRSVN